MSEETPQQEANAPQGGHSGQKERPAFLTVLCVLSYIGSGLWALLSLIGIFASGYVISLFSGSGQAMMEQAKESGDVSAEEMQAASEGINMLAGMGTTMFIALFAVSLILAVLSLIGVAKMWKQQKSGFYIYTAVNGLLFILFLISVEVFSIIVTGGFIAMYAVNLKHMK